MQSKAPMWIYAFFGVLSWFYAQNTFGMSFLDSGNINVVNEIQDDSGMALVRIPAGKFIMGLADKANDPNYAWSSEPVHEVQITQDFYIGKYEVTVGQFKKFVNESGYKVLPPDQLIFGTGWLDERFTFSSSITWDNPGYPQSESHPVGNVSHEDAVAFCEWLSQKSEEGTYRLPTEAEWEYACRAGTTTKYFFGDDCKNIALYGNVLDQECIEEVLLSCPPYKTPYKTSVKKDGYLFSAPVGQFKPNAWGLHDMIGNVSEYCQDWHSKDYYERSPKTDPQGPDAGKQRIFRGGSFLFPPLMNNSAWRSASNPSFRGCNYGFRVVFVPKDGNLSMPIPITSKRSGSE